MMTTALPIRSCPYDADLATNRAFFKQSPNVYVRLLFAFLEAQMYGNRDLIPSVVPELIGGQGIAKTALCKQFAKVLGMRVILLTVGGVQDLVELTGLSSVVTIDEAQAVLGVDTIATLEETNSIFGTGNGHHVRTVRAAPEWWPKEGEKCLIIWDDARRIQPHVLQGLMALLLERAWNGISIPAATMQVMTSNPPGRKFNGATFDGAEGTRFLSIPYTPNAMEFLHFVSRQKIHPMLQEYFFVKKPFLQPEPVLLTTDYNKMSNWRLGAIVADLYPFVEGDEDVLTLVLEAAWGVGAARQYIDFRNGDRAISLEDMITKPTESLKLFGKWHAPRSGDRRPDMIMASIDMAKYVIEQNPEALHSRDYDRLFMFITQLPAEYQQEFYAGIVTYKPRSRKSSDGRWLEDIAVANPATKPLRNGIVSNNATASKLQAGLSSK